jgi:hypothetical protein
MALSRLWLSFCPKILGVSLADAFVALIVSWFEFWRLADTAVLSPMATHPFCTLS